MLETKFTDLALAERAQLLLTMTAVQISGRNRVTVYGMLSDGNTFQPAFLDQDKKLYASRSIQWLWNQSTIVTYIDKILTETLESCPAPSPERTGFYTGKNSRDGGGQWNFGDDSEDEESDEEEVQEEEDDDYDEIHDNEDGTDWDGITVDVVKIGGRIITRPHRAPELSQ